MVCQRFYMPLLKSKKILFFPLFLVCLIAWWTGCQVNLQSEQRDIRPNILLIVADDLGYADLGCYGSDIETPNIDALATKGLRFSRFHTSPLCAPTRAMLLSGNDHHIAGMGIQSTDSIAFGYEGRLTQRIVTIPALLRSVGYHTYMAGKWHLGMDSLSIPAQKGFERSFVNLRGAGNHYNDQGIFADNHVTPYFEDGEPASWQEGDYSTDFFTEKLIEYIESNKDDQQPFFAFAAYTSPHWPLQVDEKYWKKYEGRYDLGYEELKKSRLHSLKQAGMVPKAAVLPPDHESVRPWDLLSLQEKKKESRKMELYAGMVDNLDYNVGRLVRYLEQIGAYENTLIVFMSDNGAAAEDFFDHPDYGPFIRAHFTDDYETMGQPYSFISYGPQWAEAGSSPFRHFKGHTTQGGIVTPLIIAGPQVKNQHEIHHKVVTVMDLAPTFYELAQVQYPKTFEDVDLYPLRGKSLWPILSGSSDQIHGPDHIFALEHDNKAMLRKGDWKIINGRSPLQEDNFELFHLSQDLAELQDLSKEQPEKYAELLAEWRKFSQEVGVLVPPPAW